MGYINAFWLIVLSTGNIKNVHKAWVKRIIKKRSSARITKSIEYLNGLDELKAVKTGANL
jgi:hypothetical protein